MIQPSSIKDARSGQAILIAVLTIGGAILGATTLAGILMLYTIRSTTDSANSAKAVFSADAGINWALYAYFNPPALPLPGTFVSPTSSILSDGAMVTVVCSDDMGNPTNCDGAPATTTVISEGISNGARRAFFAGLTGATGTLP